MMRRRAFHIAGAVLLQLLAAGVAQAGAISPSPSPVKFPDTGTGSTSDPITVTVKNTSANTVKILSATLGGMDAGQFMLQANAAPLTLTAGASLGLVDILFVPTGASGLRQATLSISVQGEMNTTDVAISGQALGPKTQVQPSPVVIGGVKLGQPVSPVSVKVINAGGGTVTVSSTSVAGGDAGKFSVSGLPNFPVKLGASQSFSFTLGYAPTFKGPAQATVNVMSDDPLVPNLNAPINAYVGDPQAKFDLGQIDFGLQNVGVATMPQDVNIINTGYSVMTVSGISLGGTNPGDFVLTGVPGLPLTLAVGQSAKVTVTGKPTMAGRRTSALVVTSDDPASPTKQPLFITGTNPKGMFNPASIDFGNTRVTKPNKMTFNIVNGGDGPMNVLSMDLLGNDPAQFTFQPPAPFVVAPMTMTPVQVTFTPNKVKMFSASIKVTTDDPNFAMGTLPLTGNGTSPILRVMPVSLDFGTVIVGQCAPAKSFMVCNDGNDTMKVTAFQIGGPGQQAFNGNPKLPMPTFNIAPGACNTYNIEYCPTDNTGDSATVIINTDDPNTGDAQVMLSGFGAMAQLATMPMDGETQDFGIVVEGLPKSNALVITNTGQAPLVINSIKAITMDANMMPIPSPVFSVDFTGPFPLTIPPQGKGNPKVAMKIIFAPIDEKPATATLVITPDPKTNLMPVNIPLMGTGKKAAIQCITAGALNDIDFGQVMVGTTSPVTSKTVVTIFNGDSAAQIVNVTSDKPEFMAEKAMISVPAMPVKAQFNVVFTPDLVQKFNGTIKVSLPGSTAALCSIPVTGEGVTGGTDMGPPVVTSRGGCSVGARSPAGAAGVLLVLLVGLVGRRRRRR